MNDRIRLIANPAAGGGRSLKAAEQAAQLLERDSRGFGLEFTTDLEHARDLGRQSGASGELAIAIGGDGLVGAVAAGCAEGDGLLGIIPGGRGNDLARVLGIPVDTGDALAIALSGDEQTLDLGYANGRPFCCIASLGFDSDANRIANETRVPGGLSYLYAAVRAMISWKPARFEVEVDGESTVFSGWSVIVANSAAYGGGMFIAPDADPQDGLLDVVLTSGRSKLRFLRLLPTVFSGKHVRYDEVTVQRGSVIGVSADRSFTVYADGDPICDLPATITVSRGAVRIMLPRQGGHKE